MKAILLDKSGTPDVLKISDIPEPAPAAGEVLVKLHYSGINYAEILSRKGLYGWAVERPYVLGMEGAGIIEAAGEGVDASRVGETVMIGTQYGCYAEKIALPENRAIPAISHYSMEENAAFAVNFMTAWVSLFKMAKMQPEDRVLITAAAGGVGTAAIQLAAKLGCEVYGMAGNPEKIDLVTSLGAAGAVNYRDENWAEKIESAGGGFDVVLEMVGGDIFKKSYDLLNPFGRMMIAGFASFNLKKWNPFSWYKTWRDMPKFDIRSMAIKSVAVMGSHLGYLLDKPDVMQAMFDDLKAFVVQHDIKPVIGKVFPFEAAAEAHQFIESRKSVGKILLKHE